MLEILSNVDQTRPVIAVFSFVRKSHLQRTIESLSRNIGSQLYDLVIYSDAARTPEEKVAVEAVREYIEKIVGFKSINIRYRDINYGLAKSIIDGVTEILIEYESVIVLEDDMVTSPYFLQYMNDALDRFKDDERVISVHGFTYPVDEQLPDAFFLRGADCWGWATWRRGWKLFNPDGQALMDELKRRNLIACFDFNGAYPYSAMLESQIQAKNDSWAIRWYASAFLANKLTLYPGRSLIHNIGNDSSGTHCDSNNVYDASLSKTPINLDVVEVKPSDLAREAFISFFKRSQGMARRNIRSRVKNIIFNILS